MAYTEVFRDNRIHVLEDKCKTCIFRPGNLMDLKPGRVKDMVQEAIARNGCIPCHSTIYTDEVKPAVCRGFWDIHRHKVQLLEIGERLEVIEYDPVPEGEL